MKKLSGCLKLGCFGFAVLAVAIGYSTWQVNQREKHGVEQAATATEFARFTGAKGPPADAADDAQARYRHGHLLLINAASGLVDEMFYTLPATLRAANANDVGTVTWLGWDSHQLGTYDNGGGAYKTNCDVVVYDVSRKAVVGREHVEGEDPPSTFTHPKGSKSGWEKLPKEDVLKFLQGLPAR